MLASILISSATPRARRSMHRGLLHVQGLLVASLVMMGSEAFAQGLCPAPTRVQTTPQPLPRERASSDSDRPATSETVEVSSDGAALNLDGDALLSGRVEIRQGGRELSAEEVDYDSQSGVFAIGGTVRYRDAQVIASGQSGRYSSGEGAQIDNARFELPERPAQGAADTLTIGIDGTLGLESVWFSTCPGDPAWRIRASDIEIDTVQREGKGRNAAIEFFGVPILYLPYISFPVGDQRKSGFLFPNLGYSSRGGAEISVPYYLNLAPNYDLSLQPTLFGKRGIDMGARFRYLTSDHRGDVELNYLPGDDIRDQDRSWVRFKHRGYLSDAWRLDVKAESVSDALYFEDFATGAEGTSTTFLERVARIGYRDDHWRLLGEFQHFQTIDPSLAEGERPFARVPALSAIGDYKSAGRWPLRYSLNAEIVQFARDDQLDGWRADIAPEISLDFDRPAYFIRPRFGYRHTRYDLSTQFATPDLQPSRSLPYAALDAGVRLQRQLQLGDLRRVTLEPRLLYLWTPYRNQDQLPIFDTGLPDLNFVQLFRTSRYVGADRVADANQLSTGITSRIFDLRSGRQLLSATLGQIHYFETSAVRLPGEPVARQRSDLVAEMDVTAWRNITLRLATQWDTSRSRQERSQVRLSYRPDEERALNLTYRFQRERLEQGELSGAWPIGKNWGVFSRLVYDLDGRSSLDRFAGVEYRACCWRLRAVARRFVSSRSGERETGLYLQLELNGLASVGSGADAFLEQAIRGYSLR
ncbi:MAG: LPS-assembly protein LptD [Steroidobacteraceae bacterium]